GEIASKAVAQIERASDVVKRLRALVRMDKGGRAPTKVDHIIRAVIDLCQADLNRNGIKCRTTVRDSLPKVHVDMLQIEQALLNLLRNSIDAVKETGYGRITVEASQLGSGDIEVSVRDSGPGFPAGLLADQVPPFSTTKPEGLGVGLPLARTIIEAHGG